MKCTHCGFTYDNEPLCPICGTPAPHAEPEQPAFSYEAPPAYTTPPAAPRHYAEKPAAPAAKSAPPSLPKGLLIATLCVLSVIAAALVGNILLQSAVLLHETQPAAHAGYSDAGDIFETEPGEPVGYTDSAVHKVGERFSFNDGAVCLKSVKLTGAVSALDKNLRQAAVTVVLTNTGKRTQSYYWPGFHFDDEAFDDAHFLYSETNMGNREFYALAPGKSLTAVFYYTLPKDNQALRCTVSACGFYGNSTIDADNGDFTATASYQFEIKNVK